MAPIFRWGFMGLILTLIYIPILVLVVNSFNASKYGIKWGGFTFKWYEKFWNNDGLMTAALNSLRKFVMSAFHDLNLRALDGQELPLAPYKGQVVLVVNVASKCGLTPQYAGLEKLYQQYKGNGFTVLGVPCNQFAGQEPGSEKEIKEFCSREYAVTFPMFSKISVKRWGRFNGVLNKMGTKALHPTKKFGMPKSTIHHNSQVLLGERLGLLVCRNSTISST